MYNWSEESKKLTRFLFFDENGYDKYLKQGYTNDEISKIPEICQINKTIIENNRLGEFIEGPLVERIQDVSVLHAIRGEHHEEVANDFTLDRDDFKTLISDIIFPKLDNNNILMITVCYNLLEKDVHLILSERDTLDITKVIREEELYMPETTEQKIKNIYEIKLEKTAEYLNKQVSDLKDKIEGLQDDIGVNERE